MIKLDDNEISKVLDNLLEVDEIHACMVANQNGTNVMPSNLIFNHEINSVWDATARAKNKIFNLITI